MQPEKHAEGLRSDFDTPALRLHGDGPRVSTTPAGNAELNVQIDRDRALLLGISPRQIEETLYSAYGNRVVSSINGATDQYDVIMEFLPRYRTDTILPDGVTSSFQGNVQQFQQSQASMGWLLALAVIVIYIVLGILYESFIHPLTILTELPFAGFGALLPLLFSQALTLYVTPVFYIYMEQLQQWLKRRGRTKPAE